MSARRINFNNDEGICQYRDCEHEIPDGISIQLCKRHLEIAYAAYLLAGGTEIA